jgi:hypothetical protein
VPLVGRLGLRSVSFISLTYGIEPERLIQLAELDLIEYLGPIA